MGDTTFVVTIFAIFVGLIMMLFEPGRALLGFTANQLWTGTLWLMGIVFGVMQVVLLRVWRAHVVVFRNLWFRNLVLPSVGKKTTRRD